MRLWVSLAFMMALALGLTSSAAAQAPGWRTLDLGGGLRATRYLPTSVRPCDALPLMLFLHGAGGTPEGYHATLEGDAEALGVVLLLPQATGAGWSDADVPTVAAALDAVRAELNVDETRTYFAGHSAGGAFAYLLAYEGTTGIAAVFTMAAPFYAVTALADPTYAAPIHMYYGADDPNYTGGSASRLQAQWMRFSVPQETDLQVGYGHSSWPPTSIRAGFDFLLAHRYPGTPTASMCTGDADAGARLDAGEPLDAGTPLDDLGAARWDAGVPSVDGGGASPTPRGDLSSGCGCRIAEPAARGAWSAPLACAVLALAVARRRGRARALKRARAATSRLVQHDRIDPCGRDLMAAGG